MIFGAISSLLLAVSSVAATNGPVARIEQAFQVSNVTALAEIAKLPVADASPTNRESLAALQWAAENGESWKFRYLSGRLFASLGRRAEAKSALDTIDDADEAAAFLFRATQRTGAARRADLVRARRLDPSPEAGRAMCEYYEQTGDRAAMLREARRWIGRYPTNDVIRAIYARALRKNGL